jgi:hypothetical protein
MGAYGVIRYKSNKEGRHDLFEEGLGCVGVVSMGSNTVVEDTASVEYTKLEVVEDLHQ